ncbi:hypothetical protein N9Y23_10005 [Pseudomonadales bacterium]|nr:hypothetical protein [Pseudomonadales bacterium]
MSEDEKKIFKLVRKVEEEEKPEVRGSDVVQEAADMLSSLEEAEEYMEPEVLVAIFYPGQPSVVISGVEDTNRVYVLTDFLKAELQSLIAYKDAVAAGLVVEEEEYDPTIH